ncbi:DNA repair protein RecN [Rhodovibrio salinarum]|uniref:DNA repair protein RecN n=1 Tax=Rhodovibrio salinarum TaxID=1087 RepID=A0A934UZK6_9PROT|nr:DNA repair protein RecN [Rhodovibrio salinarum]MBK1696509.1 DNA repair protein RecN [Rhodovibrio salinarum]
MLRSLAIRDVVLIHRLELEFTPGLCALTGETGAGKSILLDSLGLALGNRADSGLLRPGAEQARVTAAFDLANGHPVRDVLAEHDIEIDDDQLVMRRVLSKDGRGRAYVNDQPVSVTLLRRLADHLVEIQGQFEQRGLLNAANHRSLLDAYGGLRERAQQVAARYEDWRQALDTYRTAQAELEQARQDEAYLRHEVDELDQLQPQPGEEQQLADQRNRLMNAEKLVDAFNAAEAELTGGEQGRGAEDSLASARRALERIADQAGDDIQAALEALDRAMSETEDALARLRSLSSEIELDSGRQQEIEERYFALKDLSRKHGCEVDELPDVHARLQERLNAIDSGGAHLQALSDAADQARQAFHEEAQALSEARGEAAGRLDAAINAELPPLKLEKATFKTRLQPLEEDDWGPNGIERVSFEVATNPGAHPGPLNKIASGGELSRFLLALKVVLAQVSPERSLVFDEVDSGIGGAAAAAVGDRLARLSEGRQLLVVTHSPQVAARADHHFRVAKASDGEATVTDVSQLSEDQRREEIARMLSGTHVTDEARAAAAKLMGAA